MDQHPSSTWTNEPAQLDLPELSVLARSMLAARRALHGPLPTEMIHDPALDLLLALFVSHAAGESMAEDELASRTTVHRSVALRWIKTLEQAGLAEREGTAVKLNLTGVSAVTNTLHAVARSQWHLDGAY